MYNELVDKLLVVSFSSIASWVIVWYLIYLLTGIHLKSIGINNGFLFHGITVRSKHLDFYLGGLRFRLWGNTRMIILDDLIINIKENASKSRSKNKAKARSNVNKEDRGEEVNIFPSHWFAIKVVKFFLVRIPSITLELRHTEVSKASKITAKADYAMFRFYSRFSERHADTIKYYIQVTSNRLAYSMGHTKDIGEVKLAEFSTIKLKFNTSIHLVTGQLSNIRQKFAIDEAKLSIFNLLRVMMSKETNACSKQDDSKANIKHNKNKSVKLGRENITTKLRRVNKIMRTLLSECVFQLENIRFQQIPFATLSDNQTINEYMNSTKLKTFLEVDLRSCLINFSKLYQDAAGFEVLFDPKCDSPLNINVAIQLLSVHSSILCQETNYKTKNTDELINIPNVSMSCKSNVFDRLARGEGFKESAVEFFSSASGPALDLDIQQLSEILYNLILLKKYLNLKKAEEAIEKAQDLKYSQDKYRKGDIITPENTEHRRNYVALNSESDANEEVMEPIDKLGSQDEISETTQLKDRLISLLNEYFPKVVLKLIIEQPKIVIRNNYPDKKRNSLLDISYSLLSVDISTVGSRTYDGNCHILNPSISYREREIHSQSLKMRELFCNEILLVRSFSLKMRLKNNLTLNSWIEIDGCRMDMSNIDTLVGIRDMINMSRMTTANNLGVGFLNQYLNKKIRKIRPGKDLRSLSQTEFQALPTSNSRLETPTSEHQVTPEEFLAKLLPNWLSEADISLHDIVIKLGSRSILIPADKLSELSNLQSNSGVVDSEKDEPLIPTRVSLQQLNFKICNVEHICQTSLSKKSSRTLDPSGGRLFAGEYSDIDSGESVGAASHSTSRSSASTRWAVSSTICELKLGASANDSGYPFIHLPTMELDYSIGVQSKTLRVDVNSPELKINYSKYKIFSLVGTVHIVRSFLIDPMKNFSRSLKKDIQVIEDSEPVKKEKTNVQWADYLSISVSIDEFDCVLQLSDSFRLKLQFLNNKLVYDARSTHVSVNFFRALVKSSASKFSWARILCVDDLAFLSRKSSPNKEIRDNETSQENGQLKPNIGMSFGSSILEISTTFIRIIQPHGFVVHELFDNLSVNIKLLKYLASCLKKSGHGERIIHPKESSAINLPQTRINSKRLSFWMEDDAFECQLTVIYQLGLTEQRKRLELWNSFEAAAKKRPPEEISRARQELDAEISLSWINKFRAYQSLLRDEIEKQSGFLFGNEAKLNNETNNNVVTYMIQPPLISLIMENLDLNISSPKFALEEVPDFIFRMGQGVPKDARYSMMFPMYMSLSMDELRIHLRDYPLPLLHVQSREDKKKSLLMEGHLVVSEELLTSPESIRTLLVPLIPVDRVADKGNIRGNGQGYDFSNDPHHSLLIEKTLSSVKMYVDLNTTFLSSRPTRFVWGQSYSFGIQQAMLNLDSFSKPPVDPSPKLGFWDKLRLTLHGKMVVCTDSSIEVSFKGSRDPYSLVDTAAGFVLSFSEKVVWCINENDDSRKFFDIKSEKVSWYIPNYMAIPLVSWTRPSKEFIYLPRSKSFISSCYGYYLEDAYYDDLNLIRKGTIKNFNKKVLKLSGGVNYVVGFLLERKTPNNSKTSQKIPHWKVRLVNPKFAEEGCDSYVGFRSDYIHMAISLFASTENSYSSLHLSPGTFRHFFPWWKLFSGNMSLPIRRGRMFGELKKSMKFSQHLFTNKFQFKFENLFLSHICDDDPKDAEVQATESKNDSSIPGTSRKKKYENDIDDETRRRFLGLKGKMNHFIVDLHQRKESRISDRNGKKILKMNFNIGEVRLVGIDLRSITANFGNDPAFFKKHKNRSLNSFEVDNGNWFDIDDYEEVFTSSVHGLRPDINIRPLLFSKEFVYLRDTECHSDESKLDFGTENVHDCFLDPNSSMNSQVKLYGERISRLQEYANGTDKKQTKDVAERIETLKSAIDKVRRESAVSAHKNSINAIESRENFHNKFVLVDTLLKWNDGNRNIVLKYIHLSKVRRNLINFLSYESVKTLDKILSKNGVDYGNTDISTVLSRISSNNMGKEKPYSPDMSSKERLEKFDEIIRAVGEDKSIEEDYLVEIISPQIQLQNEASPESIILIAAPTIYAKFISVYDKATDRLLIGANELEKRCGVLLSNASVFAFNKEDLSKNAEIILVGDSYGSVENWPPWLGIEACQNPLFAGTGNLLVQDMSMMITYDQLEPMGSKLVNSKDDQKNSVVIDNHQQDKHEVYENAHGKEGIELEAPSSLHVDIPRVILSSTTKQYFTLYDIVTKLFFYTEPMSKSLEERLQKLKFSIEFEDIASLRNRVANMHQYYRTLVLLSQNYKFRQDELDNESFNDAITIESEQQNIATEMYLLMSSILNDEINMYDTSSQTKALWFINADKIVIHLLEDSRASVLDFVLANGRYKRVVKEDGAHENGINISRMQVFNLINKASFPSLLEPLLDWNENLDRDLLVVRWAMKRSVGGIRVMETFEVHSEPLNLNIDQITEDKLMEYINQSDLTDSEESNKAENIEEIHHHSDVDTETDDASEVLDNGQDNIETFIDNEMQNSVDFHDKSSARGTPENSSNNDSVVRKGVKFKMKNKEQGYREYNRNLTSTGYSLSLSTDSSSDKNYDELEAMINRSKKFLSISYFKLHPISLMISIKLKGYRRLLNVHRLLVDLPSLVIEAQILSMMDIMNMIKKKVIKTLLAHSGRLMKNKLTYRKNRSKDLVSRSLKVKKYEQIRNHLESTERVFDDDNALEDIINKESPLDNDPLSKKPYYEDSTEESSRANSSGFLVYNDNLKYQPKDIDN